MKKEYDHCIIQVDGFLVSSEIITEYFACDYEACKGACCVIGDSGAPLTEDEAEEIEKNYDAFSPLMTQAGREAVDREGFFEIDRDGDMVTPLVAPHGSGEGSVVGSMGENIVGGLEKDNIGMNGGGKCETGIYKRIGGPDDRECAYTCFDCNGACFCSIERKWFAGESSFRKPASCHLYPIRVTEFPDGTRALNLHRWEICEAAFEKGRRENVRVYEFLEEPIRQYFGSELYTALKQCAQRLL